MLGPLPFVVAMALLMMNAAELHAEPTLAAKTYREEGVRLLEAKRHAEAIKALERAIKFSSDYAEAWFDLGNAHLGVSDFESAAKAFRGALLAKPAMAEAQYNLAHALGRAGKHDAAVEAYRVYLQHQPNDAEAYFALAKELEAGGDRVAAADAFDRYAALEQRPDRAPWVAKARSQAAMLRGQAPAAAAPILAAAGGPAPTAPTSASAPVAPTAAPVVRTGAASALAGSSASPHGASLSTGASPRPPGFAVAMAALQSGDYERALEQLKSVASARPDDTFVLAALGSASHGADDPLAATEAYRKALLSAGPIALPGIQFGLAEALRMRGEEREAASLYKGVLASQAVSTELKRLAEERLREVE